MPIITKMVSLNPVHVEVYSMQHYVIKFVRDLRLVSQLFSPGVHSFLHQSKFDSYDIAEILLKVALNTEPLW
jgi:hypothetical protein